MSAHDPFRTWVPDLDGPNLLVKRLRPRQHVSQHHKRSIWRRDSDSKIIVPNRGLP